MLPIQKRHRTAAGFLFIAVCLSSPGFGVRVQAQTAQAGFATGELSGWVTGAKGVAVPRARLTVTNESTGLERSVTADAAGSFFFPLLPPGSYTITVDAGGFSRFRVTGIQVSAGVNLRVPVRLPPPTSIRGKVVDLTTGEPIAKALVAIRSQHLQTVTTETGEFEMNDVLPGMADLYISAVGFGLLRQPLELQAGIQNEVELSLGQEALKNTETVRVAADPFAHVLAEAPVEHSLTNTEMKNLGSVIFDDPMRSIQSLPGVEANNDAYAQFAVRGAGPSEIGVFVNGALLSNPFHAILDDRGNACSIGLLDSDFLDTVALESSNYPAQYGDFTGSVLEVRTREGDPSRTSYHADVSLVAASMSGEGPVRGSKKTTWLASARKDYVSLFFNSSGLGLSFYDLFGDLTYTPTPHNKIDLSGIFGETGVSIKSSDVFGVDQLKDGTGRSSLASARWIWSDAATLSEAQFYASTDFAHETDIARDLIGQSSGLETGYREDFMRQTGGWNTIQAGGIFRRLDHDDLEYEPWNYATEQFSNTLIESAKFSRNVSQSGAYVQDALALAGKRINLVAGGRWDHFSHNSIDNFLPRLSLSVEPLRNTRLTAAAGQYSQFPDLIDLYGEFGTPTLGPERSNQASFAVEQFLSERLRIRVEAFDLQTRDGIYSAASQFRLASPGGPILYPQLGPVLANSLRGYTRGLEFTLQRRSDNGLTGWIAYTLGYSRFTDVTTQLHFWGDYDQRHTFNAYASYRISDSVNVSGNARYGSGFPIVGYLGQPVWNNGDYYFPLEPTRNETRMPAYFRLDTRANKAFYKKNSKLTLYTEISNLTDHANYVYWGFVPDYVQYGYIEAARGIIFHVVPAVGLSVEF